MSSLDFVYREPVRDWEHVVFNWPLVSSPAPTLVLCLAYILFSKFLGPHLMKNREPFQIRSLILFYNVVTVILNMYIFVNFARLGWFTGYSIKCQEFDESERGYEMNWNSYIFFLSKFFDFADTMFFILTKKYSHVSYLHLIHHSMMPFYCYMGMRLGPNGHGTFACLLNSFIHVIMYSYYALALLGPGVRRFLWWKKYLTQLQLVQFALIFLHSSQLYFQYPVSCGYPLFAFYIYAVLTTVFTVLFLNFYIQSYLKPKAKTVPSTEKREKMHDVNSNVLVNGNTKKKY